MIFFLKGTDVLPIVLFTLIGFGVGRVVMSSKENSVRSSEVHIKKTSFPQKSYSFNRTPQTAEKKEVSFVSHERSLWEKEQYLTSIQTKLNNGHIPQNWKIELEKIIDCCALTGADGSEAIFVLFSKWSEVNFQEALDHAGKITGFALLLKTEIFTQLAERDHQSALAFYEQNKDWLSHDFMSSGSILGDIAQNWAEQNPDDALNWCFSIEDKLNKSKALQKFIQGVGFQSEKAEKYLTQIYDREGALPHQTIVDWISADPDTALAWKDHLKEGEIPYWQELVLEGTAKSNLGKATEMLLSLPEEDQFRFASCIMNTIDDTEAAVSWLFSVKPLSRISEVDLFRVRDWTEASPYESEKWIRNIPASETKDKVIDIYVKNEPGSQPYETVLELINSMENTEKKEKTLKSAIQKWKNGNSRKFNTWLNKGGNSELIQNISVNNSAENE